MSINLLLLWPNLRFQLRASFLTYMRVRLAEIIFGALDFCSCFVVDCHFRFSKAGMNIVDLLGILPYFASLIISLVMTATAQGQANYQEN